MSKRSGLARRQFVASVLGAGGVVALHRGTSGIAFAQVNPTVCTSPNPFRPGQDTRPITERRTVVQLASDPAWQQQMRNGYAAMRAFNANDPRSLTQQGNMHNLMCSGNAKEVHQSDRFLAWHRCFVYFQERIVSSNINYTGSGAPTPQAPSPSFRLAIWNWEGASSTPVFPSTFSSGSLNDANRANNPSTFYPGEGNIGPSLSVPTNDPFRIYGYPVGSGRGGSPVLENGPHGRIHMSTGRQSSPYHDMGNLATAALDPVFCAHHGNIDRVWAWWQGLHNNVTPNSTNPQTGQPYDPAWIQNLWYFTDWDGKCYTITPSSIIDYRNNLRYSYPAPPAQRAIRSFALAVNGAALKAPAAAEIQAASLLLNDVLVPPPGNGRFELVATIKGHSESIGEFAIFGMPMTEPVRRSVLATLRPDGVTALQAGATFTIVPAPQPNVAAFRATRAPLRVSSATLLLQ